MRVIKQCKHFNFNLLVFVSLIHFYKVNYSKIMTCQLVYCDQEKEQNGNSNCFQIFHVNKQTKKIEFLFRKHIPELKVFENA